MAEQLTDIWQEYTDSLTADENISLKSEVQQNIDFYEGKQWGKVNKESKTAHMPRPVINLCMLAADTKKAALMAGNTKLQYKSYADSEKARNLTGFANFLLGEMNFETVKEENVFDFVVKGSSAFHCYWDNEAVQTAKGHNGGVVIENLSPLNIHFSNPKLRDIQKQKWVIVSREVELEYAKSLTDNALEKELVTADSEFDVKNGRCTLLTKYYKVKDKSSGIVEVWYINAVKGTTLGNPRKIHNEAYCNDCKERLERQSQSYLSGQSPNIPINKFIRKANLYPIAFASCQRRDTNIKGRGVITDIIPNQRAINFNLAMMLVSVMNTAWGQRVVREGALQGQEITNDPAQIITDYCKNGNGIYNVMGQPFSQSALLLNDNLLQLTRTMTGSTEVMTGESKAGQSGIAIAQLQEKANKMIDDMRKSYNRGIEALGKILEMFIAIFYDENESKTYFSPKQGEGIASEDESFEPQIYIGTDNADVDYSCAVSVGSSSVYSEAVEMQVLYELFSAGHIDLETYLTYLPIDILPNKLELIAQVKKSQQLIIQQQQKQLEASKTQLQELAKVVSNVVPTIQENAKLKEVLARLQGEYTVKINQANQIITGGEMNAVQSVRTTNENSPEQGFGSGASVQMR